MKIGPERRRKALLLLHEIKTLVSTTQTVAKRAAARSASANDGDSILKRLQAEDAQIRKLRAEYAETAEDLRKMHPTDTRRPELHVKLLNLATILRRQHCVEPERPA